MYGESWPPTESYASCTHQRKHRIVRVWKLIMSKPAQVDGLGSDLGADQLMGDHQVLHVEVIRGPYVPAGHLVLGQQQRSRLQRKIEKPALLLSLPNRGCLQSGVGRFDVATGLQPASNPGMQRQQHLAVAWSTDQRARGQMDARARPRPTVYPPSKMIKVILPQLILFKIWCRPVLERAEAADLQPCRGFGS
jgi:hypothetical protein